MQITAVFLFVHVAAASIGLISGFTALLSPKGGRVHGVGGRVFTPAMLVMTACGLAVAVLREATISVAPSMLTFYLVATGWRAVTRKSATPDAIDIALLLLALVAGLTGFALGWGPAHSASGTDSKGFPAAAYFIFGTVALFASGLDARVIIARGVLGAHRLARHLWRMGVALFIAATSFFQGQEDVFPQAMHGTLLLKAPPFIVLGMMIYWLLRLLARRPPKPARAPASSRA